MYKNKIKIYIGEGRPAHDTPPFAEAELTDKQYATLRRRIHVYLKQIREKLEKENERKSGKKRTASIS